MMGGVTKIFHNGKVIGYLYGDYIDQSKLIMLTDNNSLDELFLFYMIDKHMRICKWEYL